MDRSQIEAIQNSMLEEHRRDMEALERLKRFLPDARNGSAQVAPPRMEQVTQAEVAEGAEGVEAPTLRGTIGRAMADDPNKGWTGHKMLAYLTEIAFPLQAQKPLNSIVTAMNYWVKRGCASIIRKGKGRSPNVFRWKQGVPFQQGNADISQG